MATAAGEISANGGDRYRSGMGQKIGQGYTIKGLDRGERVNYIKEMNAFYDWLESNPCSSDAIALWHALLAICNKAGWPKDFTVANSTLQTKAGLSRVKLDRWRGFLKDKNLILYKKSDKVNEAGRYTLIPFFPIVQNDTQNDTRDDTQNDKQSDTQEDTQGDIQNVHIIKTKLNKTKVSNKPPVSPKGEPSKIQYADFVFLTEVEHHKLTELLGEDKRDRFFLSFAAWISEKSEKVQKSRSAYLTIMDWHRREQDKPRPITNLNQSQYQRTKSKLQEMYQEAVSGEQAGNY